MFHYSVASSDVNLNYWRYLSIYKIFPKSKLKKSRKIIANEGTKLFLRVRISVSIFLGTTHTFIGQRWVLNLAILKLRHFTKAKVQGHSTYFCARPCIVFCYGKIYNCKSKHEVQPPQFSNQAFLLIFINLSQVALSSKNIWLIDRCFNNYIKPNFYM